MKTTLTHFSRLFMVLGGFVIYSCQSKITEEFDETVVGQETTEKLKSELTPLFFQNLPKMVRDQLRLTRKNLDKYLQGELQITDIQILGNVATEEEVKLSYRAVTDMGNVIAYGNITDPASVRVGPMRSVYSPKKLSDTKNQIEEAVSREIKIGDNVMEITWESGKKTYKTQCFYRDTGIVWDNILSGLVLIDSKKPSRISKKTVSQRDNDIDLQTHTYYRWYKRWWVLQ